MTDTKTTLSDRDKKEVWDKVWEESEKRMKKMLGDLLDESNPWVKKEKESGTTNEEIVTSLFCFNQYRKTVETTMEKLEKADAVKTDDAFSGISRP